MQINNIGFTTYYNKENLIKQKNNNDLKKVITNNVCIDNLSNINFYGSFNQIRKPLLEKEVSKKIVDKFQKFPEGCRIASEKCLFLEVGGKKYAMKIDKFDKNKMLLTVKNNVDNIENFNSIEIGDERLYCVFNDKGFMTYGELYKKMSNKYTRRFLFHTESNLKRRIKTDASFYCPANGQNPDNWHRIKDAYTSNLTDTINFKQEYAKFDFAEIFFELAKSKTSIL